MIDHVGHEVAGVCVEIIFPVLFALVVGKNDVNLLAIGQFGGAPVAQFHAGVEQFERHEKRVEGALHCIVQCLATLFDGSAVDVFLCQVVFVKNLVAVAVLQPGNGGC